jgi:hypothetical protein
MRLRLRGMTESAFRGSILFVAREREGENGNPERGHTPAEDADQTRRLIG